MIACTVYFSHLRVHSRGAEAGFLGVSCDLPLNALGLAGVPSPRSPKNVQGLLECVPLGLQC